MNTIEQTAIFYYGCFVSTSSDSLVSFANYLQSATKLVETVANGAHWQRHIHCLQRKRVQKVRFRDTPPSPTLINVVPLSTRLVENRKTQHCPGGAGEGAICAAKLEIDSKG